MQLICGLRSSQPNCPADAQPVTVQVVDSCPKCTVAQINLSYLTLISKYVTAMVCLHTRTGSDSNDLPVLLG